jgi:hypothetical protein
VRDGEPPGMVSLSRRKPGRDGVNAAVVGEVDGVGRCVGNKSIYTRSRADCRPEIFSSKVNNK